MIVMMAEAAFPLLSVATTMKISSSCKSLGSIKWGLWPREMRNE